jgi:hypothetical protein
MVEVNKYRIEDYKKILDIMIFEKLDEEIQNKINYLLDNITIDEKNENKTNYYRNKKNYNNLHWNNIRNFQKTKIVKNELDFNIKNILNKITDNNYVIQKKELFFIISNVLKDENCENNLTIIYNKIIEIIKNNIYFSLIYARLCRELFELNFFFFDKIVEEGNNLSEYLLSIENKVDKDKDKNNYDVLCNHNKNNDQKKSILMFFVNIFKNDKNNFGILINILDNILDIFEINIKLENEKSNNEDLTELIFILLTNIDNFDNKYEEKIRMISEYKVKNYPGLTNKIIFKLMDILDKYN